jgi:hypothetical protein
MGRIIDRNEATLLLGKRDLPALTISEREDILYCFSAEDWGEDPLWATLPTDIRAEIETGEVNNPEDSRFDQAVIISVASEYSSARNDWLLAEVNKIHSDISLVDGQSPSLECCPCCGRKSLGERAAWEICRVCWWEDDGQDNIDADEVAGGPNADVSLTAARLNFLAHGIYDPSRTDLLSKRQPLEMYEQGRVFQTSEDCTIVEICSNSE